MKIRTIRFWMWLNNGPVRLALRDEQELRWGVSHATDEGFHEEAIELTREGHRVFLRHTDGGRDCDGAVYRSFYGSALQPQLAVIADVDGLKDGAGAIIHYPDWQRISSNVMDDSAAAAGY